jgi:hypothetical protein
MTLLYSVRKYIGVLLICRFERLLISIRRYDLTIKDGTNDSIILIDVEALWNSYFAKPALLRAIFQVSTLKCRLKR